MKNKYIIGVILLLVIGIILITGCITHPKPVDETMLKTIPTSMSEITTRTTTTTQKIPTPTALAVPSPTYPVVNSSLYLTLNPVGTHHVGDVFEMNGTTNLPVGVIIKIHIYTQYIHTMPTGYPQAVTLAPTPSFDGITTIRKGNCGVNIWSVQANSSGIDANEQSFANLISLDPENYTINETDIGVFLPETGNLSERG